MSVQMNSIWHTQPGCVPSLHGCGWPFCLGLYFWICWIASTIDYFNYSSFSQLATFFAFLGSLSLNTCYSITLLLMVTLTSTTFASTMIVCVSTTCWTFVIITKFLWNIFCILANFGRSVIFHSNHRCDIHMKVSCVLFDLVVPPLWLSLWSALFSFYMFPHYGLSSHNLCNVCQSPLYYFVFLLVRSVWYSMALIVHSLLL